MKKLICLLLMLVMAFSLVSCVDNETPGDSSGLPEEEIYPGLGGDGIETPMIPVQ